MLIQPYVMFGFALLFPVWFTAVMLMTGTEQAKRLTDGDSK
jgi:hypothetical protein